MAQRTYRLLVVDDDLAEEPYLVVPFEDAGFNVDVATNGADAERAFRDRGKYDAIILDNMMPPGEDQTGTWSFDTTKSGLHTGLLFLGIVAEYDSPPPVWVLTGFPDADVEAKERTFGFVVDVIRKPYSLEILANAVQQYLCDRSERGDAANE